MTQEELAKLFDKVKDVIRNNSSYHVFYCYGDEDWALDGLSVSFKVYGYSDQDDGADWTEYWSIYSDGTISNSEGDCWKTFEDFEREWA